ncbi:MAG: type II secretion system protein [Myxococcales bacterium]|nr:type II secretion system protein [Myxococcales bacterium]
MRVRRVRERGFTLVEVMLAMAILAGVLTGLTLSVTRAVRVANHARLMTTATFLCRQKLVELEDKFIVEGFTDEAGVKEEHGEYKEDEFKRYAWSRTVERIHLPNVSDIQAAATKLIQDKQQIGGGAAGSAGGSPAGGSGANLGSNIGGMIGPVKEMLEQGIRRVTVRITWDEPGKGEQKVEVVTFYTDMRRVPAVPM